ncbi:hypothetical protein D3C80_1494100 [compost metagenome]
MGELRRARQGDASLAGELVEHIIQLAGRDRIVMADLGRFSRHGKLCDCCQAQGRAKQGSPDCFAQKH